MARRPRRFGRGCTGTSVPVLPNEPTSPLLEVLTAKQDVDIYVFQDSEPKLHESIPINLAAGLEDGLILEFRPPWNKAGL